MPHTDTQLRKDMPPGWRRNPREPHHCIEHDSGRIRIVKALVIDKAKYTIWAKENNGWIRPGILTQSDLGEAIEEAEKLI